MLYVTLLSTEREESDKFAELSSKCCDFDDKMLALSLSGGTHMSPTLEIYFLYVLLKEKVYQQQLQGQCLIVHE